MRTMRALEYRGGGELAVVDRPYPEPGHGEVVVDVHHCGICGTDLHNIIDQWGTPGVVGGHEWSGTIAAVGVGAGDWSVGDAVVGVPSPTCGRCTQCLAGHPSLCEEQPTPGSATTDGAFADATCTSIDQIVAVPQGVSLRHAAFTEPLAVALHAVTLGGNGPRVLVSGGGPIGAAITAVLAHRGGSEVTVVEPAPARAQLVERLGAHAIGPSELVVPPISYALADPSYDVVYECSGAKTAVETGLAMLAPRGTLVMVGTGLDRPALDTNRVLLNELVVTGAFNYDAGGFEVALAMLGEPGFPIDLLLEPDGVGLDEVADAMNRLRAGELAGKVLVEPERSRS